MNRTKTIEISLGIIIILASYYIGSGLSYLIGGFLSPAIMGMLTLFASLKSGIIKERFVTAVATFFMDYLILFFIPPIVGIVLIDFAPIAHQAVAIIVSSLVSTFVVLFVVSKVIQKYEDRELN